MNAGESALFTRRLRELARRPLVTASPRTPARDVARLLSSERVGSVVILDGGAAAGIVTDRDLRARIVEAGRDPAATPAAAIMSAPVVTAPAAALAFDALVLMTRHRIRHVVVEDDGRAAGVVSSRDLLELQAAHPVGLIRDIERRTSPRWSGACWPPARPSATSRASSPS